MAMQQSNANSCTVHLNPTRRTRTSSRHTLPDRGDQLSENTPLSRIQFVRWDGVAKQPSAHIDCVVPRDSAAVAAVKAHFLAGEGAAIGQRVRPVLTPVPAAMSTTFYPGMTCWYYHDDNRFECMGVTCIAGGDAIWVDNTADQAPAKARTFEGNAQQLDGTPQSVFYMCDNGCSLHVLLDGSVGYYCGEEDDGPGDGDGPGEGPPGGGGGPPPPPPAPTMCEILADAGWEADLELLEALESTGTASASGTAQSGDDHVDCDDQAVVGQALARVSVWFVDEMDGTNCLGDDLCLQLVQHWVTGNSADFVLSSTQFLSLINAVAPIAPNTGTPFVMSGVEYRHHDRDWSNTMYTHSIGTHGSISSQSGLAVGFHDCWDWNRGQVGSRDASDERLVRIAGWVHRTFHLNNFRVRFGTQLVGHEKWTCS